MPENLAPNHPAPLGAGVNQEDEQNYEKIINDPRFGEIINDCMMKCVAENCNEINIDCEKKCFFKICFRVAWVLFHVQYIDSVATSPTASAT